MHSGLNISLLCIGFPVDWWAMGVILYELLLGVTPFHSVTVQDLFEEIVSGKEALCHLPYCILVTHSLIHSLLPPCRGPCY